MHRQKNAIAVIAAAVTVALAAITPAHAQTQDAAVVCAGADVVATEATIPTVRSATVCLVNDIRRREGLAAVRGQHQLARAAEGHAADMVAQRYFAHGDPTGGRPSARAIRAGYVKQGGRWIVGETIGAGPNATAAEIVDAWMHSPTHRAVLLRPEFRDVGLGIVTGSPMTVDGDDPPAATFVADFGVRTKAPRRSARRI